jgi:hypothetical protein
MAVTWVGTKKRQTALTLTVVSTGHGVPSCEDAIITKLTGPMLDVVSSRPRSAAISERLIDRPGPARRAQIQPAGFRAKSNHR